MPRKKLTDSDTTARLAHLGKTLHLCRRDDSAVVKALYKDLGLWTMWRYWTRSHFSTSYSLF